jgi:hypothetical protein
LIQLTQLETGVSAGRDFIEAAVIFRDSAGIAHIYPLLARQIVAVVPRVAADGPPDQTLRLVPAPDCSGYTS